MTRTLLISSFLCSALMIGCGDDGKAQTTTTMSTNPSSAEDGDDTSAGTGGSNPTTGNTTPPDGTETTNGNTTPPDPTTSGDPSAGTGTTTETSASFIVETTGTGGVTTEKLCDVFKQDCPDGEKCAAFAEGGGGSWNATKCVPVTGEGTPGDVCATEGGGVSGLDDCQKGAFCWDVDDMNKGICVELCTGSEAAPVCSNEQDFNCAVVNEGVLNLCLPGCDPLIQDCPGDDLCIPINDTFVCVLDASGAETGKALDPCEFANACDKGLLCLQPSASSKCDANAGGCCMPFCDLADQAAADAGCKAIADDTSCVSLYEEGMAPPDFETVGICVVPG